ncbi:hypothetical protein FQN54_008434 [Arachnomyces sp. PD_36]|nr:hypothetical protein FQN54_008434 [Arachnomyces sp. PD_36]
MPHATKDMGEPTPTINGEASPYHFLDHLTSYPVVSDSITTFKNNPYGKKSLYLADQGYSHFARPFLPYLSKPYGYVAPYLEKADSLGDQGLTRVDHTFPIVMEDTQTLKRKIVGYVTLPVRLADDGKRYVLDKYSDEYKNVQGGGLFAVGKAVVSTGVSVTSESLAWVSSFLASRNTGSTNTGTTQNGSANARDSASNEVKRNN